MSRFPGVIAGVLFVFALVLGIIAWVEWRNATVLVEWSTASELNTAGFNLYRSENLEGPFLRINVELIPASSDPLAGNQYSYEDKQVMPGRLYYYQLEELETGGASTRFGPISVRASNGNSVNAMAIIAVGGLALLSVAWMISRKRGQDAAVTQLPEDPA